MGINHFFLISVKQFQGKNISELNDEKKDIIINNFFPKFKNAYEEISKIRDAVTEKWRLNDYKGKLDEKEYRYYMFPYFGEDYGGYAYLEHEEVQESLKLFTTQFPEFTFRIWIFLDTGDMSYYEMTGDKTTKATEFSFNGIDVDGMSVYITPTLDTARVVNNITSELNSEYDAQETKI